MAAAAGHLSTRHGPITTTIFWPRAISLKEALGVRLSKDEACRARQRFEGYICPQMSQMDADLGEEILID
jgi:hypothetical protein